MEVIKSNCYLSSNPPFLIKEPLTNGISELTITPTSSSPPDQLANSTARLTLTPVMASVNQNGTKILSRIGLETRTHDAPKIERHSLPSLNGSHVMKELIFIFFLFYYDIFYTRVLGLFEQSKSSKIPIKQVFCVSFNILKFRFEAQNIKKKVELI